MANTKRDRRRGIRFARVPTGSETCAFCFMLATRGAVYHTRETAGELGRFHRRCDCKVVAGTAEDPMGELVEGHDPHLYHDLWKRFEEIDGAAREDGTPLTKAERDALKAAELFNAGGHPEPIASETLGWPGRSFGKHANKHAAEFGLDVTSEADRATYKALASEVIGGYDWLVATDWPGQSGTCLVYGKGDDLVIVDAGNRNVVSLFRYERGRNARITHLRDSVRPRPS